MVSFFNCKDSLMMYHCKLCDLFINEKTKYVLHCANEKKNEVIGIEKSCDKCSIKSFSILWILSHQIKHNKIKNNSNGINSKLKSSLKIGSKFACDQCRRTFSCTSNLKLHLNAQHASHDKVIWHKCQKCNWKSKYPRSLKHHWQTKHSKENKSYECSECDYRTYQSFRLKNHMIRHIPDTLINWHYCSICLFKGKTLTYLNKHIEAVHTPKDELIWFKCDICDFKTRRRGYLKTHAEVKHSIDKRFRKYKCTQCKYEACRNIHLKTHILSKHTPSHLINWHKCNICIFKTKQQANLKYHIKAMHTSNDQVNWLICQICSARFRQEANLKRHFIAYHCTEKNCFDCGYIAKNFVDLRKHLKNKQLIVEKRFECEKCMYDTDKKFYFKRHLSKMHHCTFD